MRTGASIVLLVFSACSGEETQTSAPGSPVSALEAADEAALTAGDLTKRWEHVTVLDEQHRIFRGSGASEFYAYTIRPTGDPKVDPRFFDALYRSTDGATWHRLAMLDDATTPFSNHVDVVFGAGRLVAAGNSAGAGTLATSTDGASWSHTLEPTRIRAVARAHELFFVGNVTEDFQVSADGSVWTTVSKSGMQMSAVAYGNGVYVVFGACGMMASTDGTAWTDATPSCSVAGAPCVAPPGGAPASSCAYVSPGFFGAGKFWVMNLSSTDGQTWHALAGAVPTASAGGYLFDDSSKPLRAWRDGETPTSLTVDEVASGAAALSTEPAIVRVAFDGGATCADHRCVVVGRELYLLR